MLRLLCIFTNPTLTLVPLTRREIDPSIYVASGNQWSRKGQRKVEFHMNLKEKSRIVSHPISLCFKRKKKKREKKKERGKEWR